MTFLNDSDFENLVQNAPLCSIDLLIKDQSDSVLLGLRENEPARGFYFVPGGRILKGERLAEAFQRILRTETGLRFPISDARYLGVFEHFYETNRFEKQEFGTHYICQGYEIVLSDRPPIEKDGQHSEFLWASPGDLRSMNIHPYSIVYFTI
jgi:colanic acid biosynthesis protein WcaH